MLNQAFKHTFLSPKQWEIDDFLLFRVFLLFKLFIKKKITNAPLGAQPMHPILIPVIVPTASSFLKQSSPLILPSLTSPFHSSSPTQLAFLSGKVVTVLVGVVGRRWKRDVGVGGRGEGGVGVLRVGVPPRRQHRRPRVLPPSLPLPQRQLRSHVQARSP